MRNEDHARAEAGGVAVARRHGDASGSRFREGLSRAAEDFFQSLVREGTATEVSAASAVVFSEAALREARKLRRGGAG